MLNKASERLELLTYLKKDDSKVTVIGKLDKKIFSCYMSAIRVERCDKEIKALYKKRELINQRIEELKDSIIRYEQKEEELNHKILYIFYYKKYKESHRSGFDEIGVLERRRNLLIDEVLLKLVNCGVYNFFAAPIIREIAAETEGVEALDFKGYAKLIEKESSSFFDLFGTIINSINELDNIVTLKSQKDSEIPWQIEDEDECKAAKEELAAVKKKIISFRNELAEKESKLRTIDRDIERINEEKEELENSLEDIEKLLLYKAYAEKLYEDFLADN